MGVFYVGARERGAYSTPAATGETVLNPGGLRFPDECCRHKALDLIGDLALIGKPLLGHVIAEKAGHAGNDGDGPFHNAGP